MKLTDKKYKIKKVGNMTRKKYSKRSSNSKPRMVATKRKKMKRGNIKGRTLKVYIGGADGNKNDKKLDYKNKIKSICSDIKPLPDNQTTITDTIITVQNNIQDDVSKQWNTLADITIGKKIFKVYPITGNGDCLYESIVVGLLYTESGNFKNKNIVGWSPKTISEDGKVPSYIGNLREVLATYVCKIMSSATPKNEGNKLSDAMGGYKQIYNSINRILNKNRDATQGAPESGWGETEELLLLTKLFNLTVAVYNNEKENNALSNGKVEFEYYKNGATIIDPSTIVNEPNILHIHLEGKHFTLLIPKDQVPKVLVPEPEYPTNKLQPQTQTQTPNTMSMEQSLDQTPVPSDKLSALISDQQEEPSNIIGKSPSAVNDKLSEEQMTEIWNAITNKSGSLSRAKLITFLTDTTNGNATRARAALGFTEPLTVEELRGAFDVNSDITSKSSNTQIFHSIWTTFLQNERLDSDSDSDSDSQQTGGGEDLSEAQFKAFINCGQNRDKSKSIFTCTTSAEQPQQKAEEQPQQKAEEQPQQKAEEQPQEKAEEQPQEKAEEQPQERAEEQPQEKAEEQPQQKAEEQQDMSVSVQPEPVQQEQTQVGVNINEQEYSSSLKRVDISVFVPNNSEVVVRNYAKNTVNESLSMITQ